MTEFVAFLRRVGDFIYYGPRFLSFFDDDCDEAEFVGANPDLYLGPIPDQPTKE